MIRFLERRLVYRPCRGRVLPSEAPLLSGRIRETHVVTSDGLRLHGWYVRAATDRFVRGQHAPLVLYFPGNGGHRLHRQRDIDLWNRVGCDVLIVDYRGNAENDGRPSEAALCSDALQIWRHALQELQSPPERTLLYGGSLGGGVATALAAQVCRSGTIPAGLLLRATFTSLVDVAAWQYPWLPVRRLMTDRYPSVEHIAEVVCPLLMMHGRRDDVVPIDQGRRLFAAAPESSDSGVRKSFVEVPDAGHNDLLKLAAAQIEAGLIEFLNVALGATSRGT